MEYELNPVASFNCSIGSESTGNTYQDITIFVLSNSKNSKKS